MAESIYRKASLAMIPYGALEGELPSIKPTNGNGDFTFSRGTDTATRVNSSGLIEKETSNLLLQSNTFDTTWANASSTETGGQSGYDGTNDAWLLEKSAANGRIQQSITTSGVQTYSVYLKAGSLNWAFLMLTTGSGDQAAYFNLVDGTIGVGTRIDAKTENVGNGWYRCSVTFNASTTTARIYPADGNGDISGTSGNIYIQDAQLNQGLVAQDYLETTTAPVFGGVTDNLPRLDYSGGASCPSLLLEPQRTNLILHSEYGGGFSAIDANITITENAETSPEGVDNALKLEGITGIGGNQVVNFGGLTTTSVVNRTFTGSVYIKPVDAGDVGQDITLSLQRNTGDFEGFNSVIEIDSADWKRYDLTYTFTGAGAGDQTGCVFKILRQSSTIDDVYLYGVQLEEGSYPTSYIPTYGTSQTRAGDDCEKLSATDLIGQTEGTLFLDFVPRSKDFQIIYQMRTTGSSNVGQIDFRYQSSNLKAFGSDSATTQFNINYGDIVIGQRYKCAVRYAENNVAFYVNGSLAGVDTNASFSSSSLQQISFSENASNFYPQADVKQALIFKTPLTNAELAALTA